MHISKNHVLSLCLCVCVLSVGRFGVSVKRGTCLLCFGTPDPRHNSAGGLQTAYCGGGEHSWSTQKTRTSCSQAAHNTPTLMLVNLFTDQSAWSQCIYKSKNCDKDAETSESFKSTDISAGKHLVSENYKLSNKMVYLVCKILFISCI